MNRRFNWLKVWISLNILFFLFSQVVSSGQPQNVPVAPNDSIITAKVLEYSILDSTLEGIEPEQVLYSLRVLVISSQSIKEKPNFTQSKIDQVIKVYSKKMLSPILFGKVIQANVSFSGDERGGRYWIRNVASTSLIMENKSYIYSWESDEQDIVPEILLLNLQFTYDRQKEQLFFVVRINDQDYNDSDYIGIVFDKNHNGIIESRDEPYGLWANNLTAPAILGKPLGRLGFAEIRPKPGPQRCTFDPATGYTFRVSFFKEEVNLTNSPMLLLVSFVDEDVPYGNIDLVAKKVRFLLGNALEVDEGSKEEEF